jgi:preprotein translocase subunit SecA
LSADDAAAVMTVLGQRLQNDIYRSLLLSAISEQWVEYLTKIESLRVSIGMEAYAQRDPLVQYKGKASELFRVLLADIRNAVVSRMYTMQPRRGTETAAERGEVGSVETEGGGGNGNGNIPGGSSQARISGSVISPAENTANEGARKKRRRH